MIPTPFGAKIEIYGAGSIRATLEIERMNQAKKEKEEEQKEEQLEQTVANEIAGLVEAYVLPQSVFQYFIDHPMAQLMEYTMDINSEGKHFVANVQILPPLDSADEDELEYTVSFREENVCTYTNSSGTFKLIYKDVSVWFSNDGTCKDVVMIEELDNIIFIQTP